MKARISWIGHSTLNGELIALLSQVGANGKVTGENHKVLGHAVIPVRTILDVMSPEYEGIQTGHMGGKYIASIKGTIDAACHDACEHKRNGKCYAQFNAQSTTEPVRMIREAYAQGDGVFVEIAQRHMRSSRGCVSDLNLALTDGHRGFWTGAIQELIQAHDLGAGDKARLMIVGSTGAMPEKASDRLIEQHNDAKLSHLAYVENWRSRGDLRATHMASCYSLADCVEAEKAGWRFFYSPSAETVGNEIPDGMTMCPSSKYHTNLGRKRIGCADCGLCDGAKDGDKRNGILNIRHGNGDASRVNGLVRRGVLGRMILNGKGRTVGAYTAV